MTALLPGPYAVSREVLDVTSPGGTNGTRSGFHPKLRSSEAIREDLKASHITFAADRSPGPRFSRSVLSGRELADKSHASVRTAHMNESQWRLADMGAEPGSGAVHARPAEARGEAPTAPTEYAYEAGARIAADRKKNTYASSFSLAWQ